MQVFNAFLKTAKKNLPTILMYFFIFSGIALGMSHFLTDTENPAFSPAALSIAFIDRDGSAASAALKDYLSGIHRLTEMEYDKSRLLDQLFYRDKDYVLILPEGFEKKLLAGKTDLYETMQIPGIYSGVFVDQQIHTYLKTLKLYLTGSFSLDDAISRTADALSSAANQVHILNAGQKESSSSLKGIYYYYQFLPYVIFSMILCGMTPVFITFQEPDLAKRISCSSLSLLGRNLQLTLGSIIYGFGIWLLFGLTARIFYGPELFTRQGFLCIANSFFLLPLGIAVSLIISCFRPPANALNMFNNIITLGMSFLCGIFVPMQQLGENVRAVSKFLPFYWYIKNNNLISGFSGETFEMGLYLRNLGIQILFIGAMFSAALAVSKYRQTER